jgi:hypothetical protein
MLTIHICTGKRDGPAIQRGSLIRSTSYGHQCRSYRGWGTFANDVREVGVDEEVCGVGFPGFGRDVDGFI